MASRPVAKARAGVDVARGWAERTVFWRVWERMLEIEFVDRSVALAGKAFVSFFPLVIVVTAFLPASLHDSVFETVTHRLGVEGGALVTAKQAFASTDHIRRATGILGLLLVIFYATSFTTALQRVFLRAWRRPSGSKAGEYLRGPAWFVVLLASTVFLGGVRSVLGDGPPVALFVLVVLATLSALWWFTAWFMLMGDVRWRVLLPSGVLTGTIMGLYAASASIWMPGVVTRNFNQFGFFGIALALVTWFSGAAICVIVGTCAGAVFAADTGRLGELIRGPEPSLLVDGAAPSLDEPERVRRLRDAFRPTEDEQDSSTT